MSELVLTLRQSPPSRIDASALSPDRLAGLKIAEIERLALRVHGIGVAATGDLFAVSGAPSETVRLVGDLSTADAIGRGMTTGTLSIEGGVGRHLGAAMSGGRIDATGDAGDGVGLEMSGGSIVVRGSAGHRIGSALPGSKRGMTGGEILVFGDAGDEAAACLRRGVVAVGGNVGRNAARAAIAGTLVIAGDAGTTTGRWCKRASVIALGPIALSPTYRYACTFRPPAVSVLLSSLRRRYGFPVSPEQIGGLYRRYRGDLAESDKGEVLHWTDA